MTNRLDEILAPARAIVRIERIPEAQQEETHVAKKNRRTYYRRLDGVVTQRRNMTCDRSRNSIWDQFAPYNWIKVDTCRATTTDEAIRIFKSRPTPERAEPVKDGSHGK